MLFTRVIINTHTHVRIPDHVTALFINAEISLSLDLSHVSSTLVSFRMLKGFVMGLHMQTPMARLQVLHMRGSFDFRCLCGMPELRELKLVYCSVGLNNSDVSEEARANCFSALKKLQTLYVRLYYNELSLTALPGLSFLPDLEEVTLDARLPYESIFSSSSSPSSSTRRLHLTLFGDRSTGSIEVGENTTNRFCALRASSFASVHQLTLNSMCINPRTHFRNLGVRILSLRNALLLLDHSIEYQLLDSIDIQFPQISDDWITSLIQKKKPRWNA